MKEENNNSIPNLDLLLLWTLFKKSFVWIVLLIVIAYTISKVYLRYIPSEYESSLLFQFNVEESARSVFSQSGIDNGSKLLEELELMKSSFMLSKALEKLDLEVGYYNKGAILTNHLYKQAPYRVNTFEIYNEKIKNTPIFISFDKKSTDFSINYLGNKISKLKPGDTIKTKDFSVLISNINREIIQQQDEDDSYYFLFNNLDAFANTIKGKVQIKIQNANANTIKISVRNKNKIFSYDLVNAIFETFTSFDLEKRGESSSNIIKFLDYQLDEVTNNLEDSELKLSTYKRENKMKTLDEYSGSYMDRILEIENKVLELKLEEEILNKIGESIKKDNINVYNIISVIAGSEYESSLTSMINQLNDQLVTREQLLFSNTEESNRIKNLEFQIEIQRKLIEKSLISIQQRIGNEVEFLEGKLSDLESVMYGLPAKEIQYANLQRKVNIDEKYYLLLLDKKAEYSISQKSFVTNNQILEEPKIPKASVYPNKKMISVGFVVVGILIGGMIVVIRYLLHNTVVSFVDIQRITGASSIFLGQIPKYDKKIPVSQLVVTKSPKHYVSEAFRSLRTNLDFIKKEESKGKLIATTSTISGEGKTFVSLNLGGIISLTDKKVIILDMDLRKPKIHLGFEVENDIGMSNLLVEPLSIKEAINKSIYENLDYITAGPIPPNPSELILNGNLDIIVSELKKEYDYIIIDTPPVGIVTDGIEIISKADYPIYVFRSNYSKKDFAYNFNRLLEEKNIRNLSIVLNSIEPETGKIGNKYGYGYAYGYGYGYGNTETYFEKKETSKISRVFKKWKKKS